jgi:hypothetical protein
VRLFSAVKSILDFRAVFRASGCRGQATITSQSRWGIETIRKSLAALGLAADFFGFSGGPFVVSSRELKSREVAAFGGVN